MKMNPTFLLATTILGEENRYYRVKTADEAFAPADEK